MEHQFWIDRWNENRTGFHEGRTNAYLEKFMAKLGANRRVLVPLCGKTFDLVALTKAGHTVVGAELHEPAARAFFDENGFEPTETRSAHHLRLEASGVTIFVGDFFALTKEDVGAVDAYYDRAAMIALPPQMRTRYAAHVKSLLPSESPGLLVNIDYPQECMDGPPFSVVEAEIQQHFGAENVTLLETQVLDEGRFAEIDGPVRTQAFALRIV